MGASAFWSRRADLVRRDIADYFSPAPPISDNNNPMAGFYEPDGRSDCKKLSRCGGLRAMTNRFEASALPRCADYPIRHRGSMRIDYLCRLFFRSRSLEHPVFGLESICCLEFCFDKDRSIVRY